MTRVSLGSWYEYVPAKDITLTLSAHRRQPISSVLVCVLVKCAIRSRVGHLRKGKSRRQSH
jgi:hypothetical protein